MGIEAQRQQKLAGHKKRGSALGKSAQWLEERQISLSFSSIAVLLLAYGSSLGIEGAAQKANLLQLASYNARTGKYAIGPGDVYIVLFFMLLLTGLRASAMKLVLSPLATHWGVKRRKDATRFAEQGWMLIYYNVFWPLGMYMYTHSAYFLNMEQLWADWPQREIDGLMKFYILAQLAFWVQQVLVIHIEQRRKDHWQMLTHHAVTIALIVAAYAYHQTKVGHLIMVLMDVIDLFLPLAKCLKYLGYTWICDILFGFFVISWVLARHLFFLVTCWSVYTDLPRLTQPGCYRGSAETLRGPFPIPNDMAWSRLVEPLVDPQGIVCWSNGAMYGFLAFLLSLQVLMVIWFTFIVKIIVRIVKGKSAEDLRSDEEDDGEA